MFVKQISVFVENKPGRLAKVTKILAENNINIRALSIADTTDFGILRLIVDAPEKAQISLKDAGLIVRTTHVLAIAVDDIAGALAAALDIIDKNGISVEYMYAYLGNLPDKAMVVLKVDNPETATEKLRGTSVNVLEAEDVYKI
ncbi:MAG: ACT domain-containing protein [Clostridia bacterium]|nr:ACT domain-containing protein [Oscillospiraceae bacterium]MDY5627068.1 ACT domain-containing protein [Clostridia bacterium]